MYCIFKSAYYGWDIRPPRQWWDPLWLIIHFLIKGKVIYLRYEGCIPSSWSYTLRQACIVSCPNWKDHGINNTTSQSIQQNWTPHSQQYVIFYNVDVLYIQVHLLLLVEMQHIMRQAGIVSCPNYKSICKMHNITTSQPMKPKTNTVFVFDVSM